VFRTVLVANRGEIARRIVRGCRTLGLATVAVYSEADRDAPHVKDADRAVLLGPAPARESYLDAERLLRAAREARLTFIGPSPEAIRAMGDKPQARRRMGAAGVPIVPGSAEPVGDAEAAARIAAEIGYPVILKAAAGGGGIGMAKVADATALAAALATATRRAQSAFGNGQVYVERYLEAPRHVEVQVFGDSKGTIVHLHERECSIQRRHQKLIEESPAPNLDARTKRGLTEAALAGARAIGYVNAGTLEFLVDAQGGFYFLEMNTRLQVEHPVTEEVTGFDLVAAQLRVAAGEPLPFTQDRIEPRGAAIEVRVYAEDPKSFLPSPGAITRLTLPSGAGIRVESGVVEGSVVSVHYDPLLFKLIAHGSDRGQALERLTRALDACVVEGVKTTLPLLRTIAAHPEFRRGRVHTQMVEQGAFHG